MFEALKRSKKANFTHSTTLAHRANVHTPPVRKQKRTQPKANVPISFFSLDFIVLLEGLAVVQLATLNSQVSDAFGSIGHIERSAWSHTHTHSLFGGYYPALKPPRTPYVRLVTFAEVNITFAERPKPDMFASPLHFCVSVFILPYLTLWFTGFTENLNG